jgi:general secretion pathway protein A
MAGNENVVMYTECFKLSEPPFSLTPDPRFLYMSERHREGLAHLFYGVQQPGGFVQLTGDIGSGKTTLCRCLIKQLPPGTDIALILNPRLTVIELLAAVCDELGISYPAEAASNKVLIDALNQRLLESHARSRRTVLIIDEAQDLNEDVLEQIRLLTNLETSKEKLLQIILIGQPELLSILKQKNLRQLAQRITARYHLLALSRSETYAYIQHRLLVAGRRDPLFTRRAKHSVYRLSRGVPRAINIICDRALLGAYALDAQRISAGIVRKASRETRGILPWHRRFRFAVIAGILVIAALIAVAALVLPPANRSLLRQKVESLFKTKGEISSKDAVRHPLMPADTRHETVRPDGSVPDESPNGSSAFLNPKSAQADRAAKTEVMDQQHRLNAVSSEKPTAAPKLTDVLAGAPLSGASNYSFANLYIQMGIKLPLNPSDLGCGNARTQGYDCLFKTGNWLKLRRYDLPAILEIILPNGNRHQIAIVGLVNEVATLAIGDWTHASALSEINKVWDGSFVLLWKPPFPLRQLSIGNSGKEVLWVRHALDSLEGKAQNPADSELFDEALRLRILAFQRSQSLIQDGLVGSETLVRITVALQGVNAPSLSRRARA